MAQSTDITLANQSGAAYRSEHNSINQAFGSNHIGASAPSYILTGMSWIDNSSTCLLYTSPSPRDGLLSRMPSSA